MFDCSCWSVFFFIFFTVRQEKKISFRAIMKNKKAVHHVLFCLLFIKTFISTSNGQNREKFCPPRDVAFELVTGVVYTSPNSIVDTMPGVLKLEACIEQCRSNSTCFSVNYETGLCVLFSTSADMTPGKPFIFILFVFFFIKNYQNDVGRIWREHINGAECCLPFDGKKSTFHFFIVGLI
jgi:hypothetical protein